MKMMDNERFLIIPEKEKGLSSFDPDRVLYTKLQTGMSYGVQVSFDGRILACFGKNTLRMLSASHLEEIATITLKYPGKSMKMTDDHIFIQHFEENDDWTILSLKETGLSKGRMEAALNNMSFDEYQAKEANKMRVAIRGYIEKRMKAARIKAA
jgi:hypothetical protein